MSDNGKGMAPKKGYNAKKWYENWDDAFHPRKLLPLSAHPYPPPCPFDDPVIAKTPRPLGDMHSGYVYAPYIPKIDLPVCPACGHSNNMILHSDGKFYCHSTHRHDL